jgi:hypothetical protein
LFDEKSMKDSIQVSNAFMHADVNGGLTRSVNHARLHNNTINSTTIIIKHVYTNRVSLGYLIKIRICTSYIRVINRNRCSDSGAAISRRPTERCCIPHTRSLRRNKGDESVINGPSSPQDGGTGGEKQWGDDTSAIGSGILLER